MLLRSWFSKYSCWDIYCQSPASWHSSTSFPSVTRKPSCKSVHLVWHPSADATVMSISTNPFPIQEYCIRQLTFRESLGPPSIQIQAVLLLKLCRFLSEQAFSNLTFVCNKKMLLMVLVNTCESHWSLLPLTSGPNQTSTTNKLDNKTVWSWSSDTRLWEAVTSLDEISRFQCTFLKGKVTAMNRTDKVRAADSHYTLKECCKVTKLQNTRMKTVQHWLTTLHPRIHILHGIIHTV